MALTELRGSCLLEFLEWIRIFAVEFPPKKSYHPTRKEPFIVRYSFGIRTVPEAEAMTHILRYANPPSRLQDCPFSPIVPGRRACVSPHAGRSG